MSNVSTLASCESLHTLELAGTRVSDMSPLASCQALHTLDLAGAEVCDVSALVACGSLQYLRGDKQMIEYYSMEQLWGSVRIAGDRIWRGIDQGRMVPEWGFVERSRWQ
jgi:hypothetical protein